MNLLELGDLLRREREKHGLSVRDVMEATKISRRNLNALEDGAVKLLPHPVYLKGYVRNYARLVGLDCESLAAIVEQQSDGESGYLPQSTVAARALEPTTLPPSAIHAPEVAAPLSSEPLKPVSADPVLPEPSKAEPAPEAQVLPTSLIRPPKPADLTPKPPRRVWPWILLLVIAGVLSVLYVQYQRIQAEVAQPKPPVAAPAPVENATLPEANATQPDANATQQDELNATQSESALVSASSSAGQSATGQPAPAAKPLPLQSQPSAVSATPVAVSRKPQAATLAPDSAVVVQSPVVRTPGMQELVVTAKPNEACWVEVSEGAQRKSFTLRNGESRRVEFSHKAKVRLGNAGGVNFLLNGANYPFEGERGATATLEIGAH
jgi:cytoskeleton protein RodZ